MHVKETRQTLKLTQAEMADKLGCSLSMLKKYEADSDEYSITRASLAVRRNFEALCKATK